MNLLHPDQAEVVSQQRYFWANSENTRTPETGIGLKFHQQHRYVASKESNILLDNGPTHFDVVPGNQIQNVGGNVEKFVVVENKRMHVYPADRINYALRDAAVLQMLREHFQYVTTVPGYDNFLTAITPVNNNNNNIYVVVMNANVPNPHFIRSVTCQRRSRSFGVDEQRGILRAVLQTLVILHGNELAHGWIHADSTQLVMNESDGIDAVFVDFFANTDSAFVEDMNDKWQNSLWISGGAHAPPDIAEHHDYRLVDLWLVCFLHFKMLFCDADEMNFYAMGHPGQDLGVLQQILLAHGVLLEETQLFLTLLATRNTTAENMMNALLN